MVETCGKIEPTAAEAKLLLRLRSLPNGAHLLTVRKEHQRITELVIHSEGNKVEKLADNK